MNGPAQIQGIRREAGPLRIWSLLEILRFHAMPFCAAISNLARAEALLILPVEEIGGTSSTADTVRREKTIASIADLSAECSKLPISKALEGQLQRLLEMVKEPPPFDNANQPMVMWMMSEVRRNLTVELASHYYLMIDVGARHLYEQRIPLFGPSVATHFPDAIRDIASAGRCLALEEWTAAVFHLMRVLEHGLRYMANSLQVTFSRPMELLNWQNIIDSIEKAIRQQANAAKRSGDELQFYAEAANQFWNFKAAWRNHVSHARATYDRYEAFKVWSAVQSLMKDLAERQHDETV